MPPREISVAEDETFHPEICLVGIEPVSNFILVEQCPESSQVLEQEPWGRFLFHPFTECLYNRLNTGAWLPLNTAACRSVLQPSPSGSIYRSVASASQEPASR
jgi:hypothetical protein